MNRGQIEASKQLAQEFIKTADAALARIDTEQLERIERWKANGDDGRFEKRSTDHSWGSPETGALKRKSMDLTRSLAVLRK